MARYDLDVHFVAFHVEPTATAMVKLAESRGTFGAEVDYRILLGILFSSARLFHPAAVTALLSDEKTPFDSSLSGTSIVRLPVDPDRVMYSRVQGQIEYLRHYAGVSPVVFLDSDIIVNTDLTPLLSEEFDVALTYRDHPRTPLNGGVLITKGGSRGNGLRFMERLRSIYDEQFSSARRWWGDQRALIAAVGHDRFAQRTSDSIEVDGTRIRLLPCDPYNFSPANAADAIAEELGDKLILHFKGERKRLMPHYWANYLEKRAPGSQEST
jgi:hypothetical protein